MDTARIAFTVEQCWHDVPGGTAVAAIETARAMASIGEVELVGVAAKHRHPAPPAWAPPLDVRHLALPRLALYESWHRLRRPRVEAATGPVDVVHATTIAIPPRSAPLVVTIHDLAWLEFPQHFTRRGVSFFDRGLALARAEADLIICPSHATAAACSRAGIERERMRVVHLGVDTAPASVEEVETAKRRYGLDRPYVLWVGTVEPRKNLKGLLSAFSALEHDLDLALVGPEGWNEDLDGLVGDAGPRVKRLGFLPHGHLAPLYAGATVFCWPSFSEGFGFPVLEAMAQGTPVVTARGTSTEEVSGDAAVLVDPHDVSSIVDGLGSALSDDVLRARLSDRGRARAAEFTWARTARKVADVYAEATS